MSVGIDAFASLPAGFFVIEVARATGAPGSAFGTLDVSASYCALLPDPVDGFPLFHVPDLSDSLARITIARSPDGDVDPMFRSLAEGTNRIVDLTAVIPDDDYFVVALAEGEHLGVVVTDAPVMIDVEGPPFSEPAFFQVPGTYGPQPAGLPNDVGPGREKNTDGANGERGYLWSVDGRLRLVAFRDGTYTIRVRALDPPGGGLAIPANDYTIHFFVHSAKEPVHGKFPAPAF